MSCHEALAFQIRLREKICLYLGILLHYGLAACRQQSHKDDSSDILREESFTFSFLTMVNYRNLHTHTHKLH